jgi:hypothetical protein
MGDFARKFTAETKGSRSQFDPAPDRVLGRDAVKSRIDFDRRKIPGIKFEPFGIQAQAPIRIFCWSVRFKSGGNLS